MRLGQVAYPPYYLRFALRVLNLVQAAVSQSNTDVTAQLSMVPLYAVGAKVEIAIDNRIQPQLLTPYCWC